MLTHLELALFYAWNLFLISSLMDLGKKNMMNNKIKTASPKDARLGQRIVVTLVKIKTKGIIENKAINSK